MKEKLFLATVILTKISLLLFSFVCGLLMTAHPIIGATLLSIAGICLCVLGVVEEDFLND